MTWSIIQKAIPVFESGQLELNSDFIILNSTSSSIDIGHISGSIPQGPLPSLIDFCLFNDDPSSAGPIDYIISYIQEVNGQEQVACEDIVTGDCDQGVTGSCASISTISILCSEDKEAYYEITLNISNESGNAIDQLQLSGLPSGMSWSPCDVNPPIVNTVLNIQLDNLQPGESMFVCVRIYTNSPVSMLTNIVYAASFIDSDGKTFCTLTEQELELIPCCDPCKDINILVSETSDCCYTVTMNGFCFSNNYHELNISVPDGVLIVNSNVSANNGQIQPWVLCDNGNEDLCVVPRGNFFTDAAGANQITFCLSGEMDGSEELTFNFRNDKSDILCTKTETVSCNGGCVTEGFESPVLTSAGLQSEKLTLECDAPPLILRCPKFEEVWIKGRFDCSASCESKTSVEVLLNGVPIKAEESVDVDGTWEVYLTDIIKKDGLYQIVVQGDCDGEMIECTYSFIVQKECYSCNCKDLVEETDPLLSVLKYDGCQRGFQPVGLDTCDTVLSWTIDGNVIGTSTSYNEEFKYDFAEGSNSYELCMEVQREDVENDTKCKVTKCIKVNVDCKNSDIAIFECETDDNPNGSFSLGTQGSLHDNTKSFLPSWVLLKGEAWYFEKNGSLDQNSGYVQLAYGQDSSSFDDAFTILSTQLNGFTIEVGDQNLLRVYHDVLGNKENLSYGVAILNGSDTIIMENSLDQIHIWESNILEFSVSDDVLERIIADGAELRFATCCDGIEDADDIYRTLNVDNVCVEITKNIVSTSDINYTNSLEVYPIPTLGVMNLELQDNPNGYNCKLIDVLGQTVKTFNFEKGSTLKQIQIDEFEAGAYMLFMIDNKSLRSFARKILKI